jgi:hypothetical protein
MWLSTCYSLQALVWLFSAVQALVIERELQGGTF